MQELLASVESNNFLIERSLELQLGALPLPFPGMDKSGSAICNFFISGTCSRSVNCSFRHVRGDRTIVCKHWLRGLCKKGDNCEFLHEYDMQKMPECYFYSRFGECGNKDCPFLHIDPEQKIKACAWYDRGFCRHGSLCKNKHVRRVICLNYLCGFCLDGPSCKYVHPRFELPTYDNMQGSKKQGLSGNVVCHFCMEPGHKAIACPKLPQRSQGIVDPNPNLITVRPHNPGIRGELRPIDQVTCFKCGEKGHYANKCPKGAFGFLANLHNQQLQLVQQQQQLQQHNQSQPNHPLQQSQQQLQLNLQQNQPLQNQQPVHQNQQLLQQNQQQPLQNQLPALPGQQQLPSNQHQALPNQQQLPQNQQQNPRLSQPNAQHLQHQQFMQQQNQHLQQFQQKVQQQGQLNIAPQSVAQPLVPSKTGS